ncbi:Ribosomal protein L11 methyltransferase [Candidatus Rhodobacter oscarellae]|uniref:Ribosomal protein L11 methyltransferase n=1 Tax=Candidatus Rhodobacter oscarellae TaxID=1675527 RepID=A0A0J9E184_9RHOB|nr:50S ribosomal protein L11 methyltransferase [Candidatus Rhodobacter lobularis]KMW56447.1 Ribosomal protein L11 methyltransferase [Candidatus Rhodobacter lobularis]
MTTYTALTTLTGRAPAEALGEAMERLDPEPTGVGVFEVEDGSGLWEVGGYFEDVPDAAALAVLAAAFGAKDFAVSELPEVDWVAHVRRELAPVEAGRFFVYGSHDADKVPAGRVPLLIEAAMAFGTGHHGTTLGCLRALDRIAARSDAAPQAVLDLGCGTAVLAMGAAHVWPEVTPWASDIDQVAVEVAEANLAANDLTGRVRCVEAVGLDHPELQAAAPFDLIFANILKGPLLDLAPSIWAATAPGGVVILSGILTHQGEEIRQAYGDLGFNLEYSEEIVDWLTLVFRR